MSDAEPPVDTLADFRKQWSTRLLSLKKRWSRDTRGHTEICAATCRHAGRLAQAVVNTLVEWQADVKAETLCDTLSDAQAMVDTLSDLRKRWSTRCLIFLLRFIQKRKTTH